MRPGDFPAARFSVYYRSLHEAGGDFYDVVPVSDGVFFYLVADVAGHDVGTSYVTPAVKVLLSQFATPAYSVEESIGCMNGVLSKTILEDTYLTAFALRVNRRAGKAVFLAAGPSARPPHPEGGPRPLRRMREHLHRDVRGHQLPLGVDRQSPRAIASSSTPTAWSSSATRPTRRRRNWSVSRGRLLPIAEALRGLPLEELPEALVRGIGAEFSDDDVAVMAVEA